MGRRLGEASKPGAITRLLRRDTVGGGLTVLLAVLAALLFLVSSFGSATAAAPAMEGNSAVSLPSAAIPTTQINLNLSESGTSYYPEFVTLNNTSTIYRLPYVVTSRFSWVTVLNLSRAEGPLHSINYAQVTAANDSGTVVASSAQTGFEARGGQAYWVDYTYWTYNIYGFSAPGVAVAVNLHISFGDYPGHTTGPANLTVPVGGGNFLSVKVSDNVTVSVLAPRELSQLGSCGFAGTVCNEELWNLTGWKNSSSTPSADPLLLGGTSGLKIPLGGWDNYTAVYAASNTTTSTGTGSFILATESVLSSVFLTWWYLWVLLVVLLVAYAAGRDRNPQRRRRR